MSAFFTVLIFTLILVFAVKYRRSTHPVAEPTESSIGLELFWTLVPFLITIVIFIWSSKVYMDGEIPPKGAENIYVVGKQWMWKIQHPEGRREINELHIPLDTPINSLGWPSNEGCSHRARTSAACKVRHLASPEAPPGLFWR